MLDIKYTPILNKEDLSFWEPYYKEFEIRYYWKPSTYYNIFYKEKLIGVCGLQSLRKNGHYLMRGDYILEPYRKLFNNTGYKSIHKHSILFRMLKAGLSGATHIWVRCNENSIKNYQYHGFKKVNNTKQRYIPLCLKLQS